LQAFFEKRTRHSVGAVFDHFSSEVRRDGAMAWNSETPSGNFELVHEVLEAFELAQESRSHGEYWDIHNWRFTPASFRLILRDLRVLGMVHFSEARGFPTDGFEFFISLRKGRDTQEPKLSRIALMHDILREQASIIVPSIQDADEKSDNKDRAVRGQRDRDSKGQPLLKRMAAATPLQVKLALRQWVEAISRFPVKFWR
jgi:hypothetical protein